VGHSRNEAVIEKLKMTVGLVLKDILLKKNSMGQIMKHNTSMA